jgi:hypothetical protein
MIEGPPNSIQPEQNNLPPIMQFLDLLYPDRKITKSTNKTAIGMSDIVLDVILSGKNDEERTKIIDKWSEDNTPTDLNTAGETIANIIRGALEPNSQDTKIYSKQTNEISKAYLNNMKVFINSAIFRINKNGYPYEYHKLQIARYYLESASGFINIQENIQPIPPEDRKQSPQTSPRLYNPNPRRSKKL